MNQPPLVQGDHSDAEESPAFWTMFALAFVVLFVASLLAILVRVQWRTLLPGAENSKGLVEGVSAAVYTFMSHIT
jgi:light-harvesting complex 1 beta chain